MTDDCTLYTIAAVARYFCSIACCRSWRTKTNCSRAKTPKAFLGTGRFTTSHWIEGVSVTSFLKSSGFTLTNLVDAFVYHLSTLIIVDTDWTTLAWYYLTKTIWFHFLRLIVIFYVNLITCKHPLWTYAPYDICPLGQWRLHRVSWRRLFYGADVCGAFVETRQL